MKIGELIRAALQKKTNDRVFVRIDGACYPLSGVSSVNNTDDLIIEVDQQFVNTLKEMNKKSKK